MSCMLIWWLVMLDFIVSDRVVVSVAFVILRRPSNTCFFLALPQRVFIVFVACNIPPPTNVTDMLNGVDKKIKTIIRIGVPTLCWSIWTCVNNLMLNKTSGINFFEVIRLDVHWIQFWSFLFPPDQREHMTTGRNRLLTVARDFFSQVTCRHISRIHNG